MLIFNTLGAMWFALRPHPAARLGWKWLKGISFPVGLSPSWLQIHCSGFRHITCNTCEWGVKGKIDSTRPPQRWQTHTSCQRGGPAKEQLALISLCFGAGQCSGQWWFIQCFTMDGGICCATNCFCFLITVIAKGTLQNSTDRALQTQRHHSD